MAKLILIVDDDMNFVTTIARRLKAGGYEILAAFDAISAVRQAQEKRPDLIILDLKLPAGGGFKTYQHLKTSINTALIPILFVTGFSKDEFPEMAKIEDFEKYLLTKPFAAEDLLAMIKSILEGL